LIPSVIVGVVGHVDHGKTTLVQALTGIWTAKYSEELKRSMTIKLGYADGYIALCPSSDPLGGYTREDECPGGTRSTKLRRFSYVDAPGHEILMATMLAGASLIDAALVVIAANEPCPQPQTREHVKALELLGVEQVIVVQNKIDVVSPERVRESYEEIKNFLSETKYAKSPIIPVSALHRVNIDALMAAMHHVFKEPERDLSKPALMYIARSFDVNKPGTKPSDLAGGVIGGALIKGEIRVGDIVEIKPGIRTKTTPKAEYTPIETEIVEIRYGSEKSEIARPGGLVALQTKLDPSLTKADAMIGNVVGHSVPDPVTDMTIEYHLFERVIGSRTMEIVEPIKPKEKLIITIGTAIVGAVVRNVSKERLEVVLDRPVVVVGRKLAAITRQVKGRWRLVGWGRIVD